RSVETDAVRVQPIYEMESPHSMASLKIGTASVMSTMGTISNSLIAPNLAGPSSSTFTSSVSTTTVPPLPSARAWKDFTSMPGGGDHLENKANPRLADCTLSLADPPARVM